MLKRMMLEWLVENDPEHLEKLLDQGSLEDWLEAQLQRWVEIVAKKEAQGLQPWQAQELANQAIMPSDAPEPSRPLRDEYRERVDDLRLDL